MLIQVFDMIIVSCPRITSVLRECYILIPVFDTAAVLFDHCSNYPTCIHVHIPFQDMDTALDNCTQHNVCRKDGIVPEYQLLEVSCSDATLLNFRLLHEERQFQN